MQSCTVAIYVRINTINPKRKVEHKMSSVSLEVQI